MPHDADVLAALGEFNLEPVTVEPILMGNINRTFRVTSGAGVFTLQVLNPIFSPKVNEDIEAVTAHLAARGMVTPRLVRTTKGMLWTTDGKGQVWRLLTHVDGTVLSSGTTSGHCRRAGELLGQFHVAVSDLEYSFCNVRTGVHDTKRHRRHLQEVMQSHKQHTAFYQVAAVGEEILARIGQLPALGELPQRIVHGDPKINNVVFSPTGAAICLIDLDTLAKMSIPVELGDAFRSWCNPVGEDGSDPWFDLERFVAGLEGYAQGAKGLLTAQEWAGTSFMVETITLELAARFCTDALEESYFGWNKEVFSSASAHNLHRAKIQLGLARSVGSQRVEIADAVRGVANRLRYWPVG